MAAPLGKKRANSNMLVTDNLTANNLIWRKAPFFGLVPLAIPLMSQCVFLPMHLATSVSVFAYVSGHLSICSCLCIWPPQYLFLPMHLATSVCFCLGIWSHQCVFAYVSGIFTWPHSWPCGVCKTCLSHTLSPQHHRTRFHARFGCEKKIFRKTPVAMASDFGTLLMLDL